MGKKETGQDRDEFVPDLEFPQSVRATQNKVAAVSTKIHSESIG